MENALGRKKTFRGQAAMEYLVTYGWALLVLVIVIGVLMATGVFSPANFQPEECNFQPDFPCQSYIAYNDASGQTNLLFNASNGFGFPIKIESVTAMLANGAPATGVVTSPAVINQGETMSAKIPMAANSPTGSLQSFYVSVSFRNCYLNATPAGCASLPLHNITGRLTTRINSN